MPSKSVEYLMIFVINVQEAFRRNNLIIYALTIFLFLTIPIEQCIAQNFNQDVPQTIVAQIAYTLSTVEMIEDDGYDSQAGAFRGIFLFKGKQYVA